MGLGFLFTAKDMASEVMEKVEHSLHDVGHVSHETKEQMEGMFKSFAIGGTLMAAGYELFEKVLEPAIHDAHEFEAAIALVSTRVSEAQYPHERLAEDVTKLGIRFGVLPTEEAKVFYDAVANGADDSAKMTGLMTAANELAIATQGDLHESMSSTAELLKVYGIAFEDATEVTDRLFVASSHIPGGLQGMESILDKIAPVAKRAGVGMDSLLGYVQQLSAAGIQGRPAVAGLKAVIDAMITHGPNVLAQSVGKTNAQLQQLFGSSEGATVAMALMRNGGQDLAGVMDQLAHSTGATAEAAQKMLEAHPEKQFAALSQAASKLLGKALLPLEEGFFRFKNAILTAFLSIPKPIIFVIAKVLAAVSGILVLVGAALALKAAIGLVSMGLGAVGVTLGGVVAAVLPVVAVIGAVVGAVYLLRKAWETNLSGIRDFMQPIVDKIKLTFLSLYELFSGGGFTADTWKQLEAHSGIRDFAISVFMWVGRIENFFVGLRDGFVATMSKLGPALHIVGESITRVTDAFGRLLGGKDSPDAAATSFDRFGAVGVSVATIVGNVFTALANVAAVVFGAWLDYVAGVVDGFQSGLGPAAESMTTVFGFLWDQIKNLLVTLGVMTESTANAGSGWQTFGKIVGFVGGVIVQIVGGIAAALGGLVWLIDKIVAGLKYIKGPSPADILAQSGQAQGETVPHVLAGSGSTAGGNVFTGGGGSAEGTAASPFKSPATASGMTMPSLAAGSGGGESGSAALEKHLAEISKNTAQPTNVSGVVLLDGEAVGRFQAKGKKSDDARGFNPTPVET